jgi:putative ATP-binding cassette transporter
MSRAAPALGVARRSFGRALRLRLEGFAQLHFDARARTECRDELCALEQGCAEGQGRLNQTLGGSLAWGEDVLLLGLAVVLFRLPEAAGLSAGTQYQVTTMILSMSGMTLVFLALSFQVRLIGGAYERLGEIEGQLAPGSGPAQTRPLLPPGPELSLEIQRACFAYEAGGFRVGPIDCHVRGGEQVIIRGGNGSGKTTLMRVLAGLYPASSGALILGGSRVEARDAEWYRAHVTAIFTGQHLFDAPYGLSASPDEVAALLDRFGLSDAVALKDGRFTRTTLSSGQSKRLAMVVALLEHRPILLLDEWDSHQDPGLRTFYYETLLPELKGQGKIVIAVSHDARRFHLADHLLHLEGGKMVVEGDQAEGVSPRGDTPPQGA